MQLHSFFMKDDFSNRRNYINNRINSLNQVSHARAGFVILRSLEFLAFENP